MSSSWVQILLMFAWMYVKEQTEVTMDTNTGCKYSPSIISETFPLLKLRRSWMALIHFAAFLHLPDRTSVQWAQSNCWGYSEALLTADANIKSSQGPLWKGQTLAEEIKSAHLLTSRGTNNGSVCFYCKWFGQIFLFIHQCDKEVSDCC